MNPLYLSVLICVHLWLNLKVETLDKFASFLGAVIAIHAWITPFYTKRAFVANGVERADDRFPIDAAVSGRAKFPTAARISVRLIRVEDAGPAIEHEGLVFDVDVEDTIGKSAQELHGIDSLPVQMARIEGEAELRPAFEGFEGHFGAIKVEGDLARMHFEGEADAGVGAGIEDRGEAADEILHALFDLSGIVGRIAHDAGPKRRTGEPADDADA
jgi:hypothetical protein